ncbi:amidophosphoribosyltransferase [Candidatus Woesearchaeota archaeon]|nr:MAG: amidophosphoribosyltransferase [Candidatus Woesearchaeota archaeon]
MCGIIGIIGADSLSYKLFLGMQKLQDRGQDAAGMITYNGRNFHFHRGSVGEDESELLVKNSFTHRDLENLTGFMGIGHVRYPTVGAGRIAQPLYVDSPYGIAMGHNGNIVNYLQLRENIETKLLHKCNTDCDIELILHLFAHSLDRRVRDGFTVEKVFQSVDDIMSQLIGSYSVVALIGDKGILAFRDPNGIKPLLMGEKRETRSRKSYAFASERSALYALGYENIHWLKHGEAVFADTDGNVHSRIIRQGEEALCEFEGTYFSRPESDFNGRPNILLRKELARALAPQLRHLDLDYVFPVPDTSNIGALELARELGVPFEFGLIRDKYATRTFIMPLQEYRELALELKLIPIREFIEGKKILLVEDSIVRGTTSSKVVSMIRAFNPKKVYMAVYSPPRRFPCFYGIDFPVEEELIARGDISIDQIAERIGVDGLFFQKIEDHKRIYGVGVCMACLTGEYPTDVSAAREFVEQRMADRITKARGHAI